jgi:photosystem II stability/assembly factor-like uncharacterized protein
MRKSRNASFLAGCAAVALLFGQVATAARPKPGTQPERAKVAAGKPKPAVDPDLFKALKWREVGPFRGGRSAAVTGLAGNRSTYYFGSTGGGVWRTLDAGKTWSNVSDGSFGGSVGAVAVSEWDPNVIYAGGGEVTVRGNVSHGDGLWKSTDAGKTWKLLGLQDGRQIPRIRIHPKNPDLVYAAVLGHVFGPNATRGVYRSKDGGASWERVLYVNDRVGAVDLAMDPVNPRVLYASTWSFHRTPYSLESGGPGSGLWKSTDGGDSWTELTQNPGFPKGTLGIIGVSVSRSNPENVYALVEAEAGGVLRSRDGGRTWTKVNEERNLRQRAWYYSRIYADPKNEEVVYVVNVQFLRSQDGGKSFRPIRVPHGDNHDLWIDPDDPQRMIEANDGGACITTDGGVTWTSEDNQPTAQFYRVSTDNHFPYRILGPQQDNSAVRILSRSPGGNGVGPRDWDITAGGESGYIVADPRDPDVVYGGSYGGLIVRLNHRTGESRDVNPWPDNPMGWGAGDLKYRFQWNFPILFSPNDPKVLYTAANHLFRTTDEGASWQEISPDLTRNDKSTLGASGGTITKDNTSVEYYATIFTVAESPLEPGVIWAGSDDGLVHVSRDAGKSWQNVTPKGMPDWMMVNSLEASPLDKGAAYFAGTRYKSDDLRPYLYKTADYGATWTRIDNGIDPTHFTRVVRADPMVRGLLYAGTEHGAYVSFDDGVRWQPLQLNLPIVPVTDLTIKEGDLIAATQGRSFWVLDDLSPLRELATHQDVASAKAYLFPPRPAYRLGDGGGDDDDFTPPPGIGKNPPSGAVLHYFLREAPKAAEAGKIKLEILASDGTVIRTFKGEAPKPKKEPRTVKAGEAATPIEEPKPAPKPEEKAGEAAKRPDQGGEAAQEEKQDKKKEEDEGEEGEGEKEHLATEAGLNRFVWDLNWPASKGFKGMILWAGREGIAPLAVPGRYQARLTAGDQVLTQSFEVKTDPRSSATQEDMVAQLEFVRASAAKLTEAHDSIRRIRDVRAQLDEVKKRYKSDDAAKPVLEAAKEIDKKMTAVEEALYQTKNRSSQDPLNYPIRLTDKLSGVAGSASQGDYRPTAQAVAVQKELVAAIDVQLAKLKEVWDQDLKKLNDLAHEKGVAPVVVPPAKLK